MTNAAVTHRNFRDDRLLYNNRQTAASHSRVDVLVPERGWISLATFIVVTHNRDQTGQHVRSAVGRDYGDVPPTRGVFKGNAREKMDVQVSVTAL